MALLLIGGALFVRPNDLHRMSRMGGRLSGSLVHGLRSLRKVASDSFKTEPAMPNELKGLRESFIHSFKQLEDVTRTFSREVAESSPVAGLRSATTFKPNRSSKVIQSASETQPKPASSYAVSAPEPAGLASVSSARSELSGAAIVAKVIEESAFAQQEARVLGQFTQEET